LVAGFHHFQVKVLVIRPESGKIVSVCSQAIL
jgi:hypothetical protein